MNEDLLKLFSVDAGILIYGNHLTSKEEASLLRAKMLQSKLMAQLGELICIKL